MFCELKKVKMTWNPLFKSYTHDRNDIRWVGTANCSKLFCTLVNKWYEREGVVRPQIFRSTKITTALLSRSIKPAIGPLDWSTLLATLTTESNEEMLLNNSANLYSNLCIKSLEFLNRTLGSVCRLYFSFFRAVSVLYYFLFSLNTIKD